MNICITSLCIATVMAAGVQAATCTAVNVNGGKASAMRRGAESAGVALEFESEADFARLPDILVWQADEKGATLTDADVGRIAAHLADGAGLLVTLSRHPGADAFRLAPVSPTTAWRTIAPAGAGGGVQPAVESADASDTFFTHPIAQSPLQVPFRFRLRPLDAAELGETRMEGNGRDISCTGAKKAAGEPSASRPLLNRGWQTVLGAKSEERDALLVTGRYGAGRVAVFASSAEAGTDAFWKDVFAFLAARPKLSGRPEVSNISFSADANKDEIVFKATNGSKETLKLPVLARVSSWNGEYVADISATFAFPAGKTAAARLKIPDEGRLRAQSLDFRRAYKARVAVFSPDSSSILGEGEVSFDHYRGVSVDIEAPEAPATEENRPPLPGPLPEAASRERRGGAHVGEYCFAPGSRHIFRAKAKSRWTKDVNIAFDIVVKPFNAPETVLPEKFEGSVAPGGELVREFEVELPALRGGERFGAGRIELVLKGRCLAYVPYIVADGSPGSYLRPVGADAVRGPVLAVPHESCAGLTNWLSYAAGADGSRDAEIFAYSRRINQAPRDAVPDPSRLFLSETGFTEHCSAWSHAPDGERFMEAVQSDFMGGIMRSAMWNGCAAVRYDFGADWDVGPSVDMMLSWQEIVEFDRRLRASGARGLQGDTLRELRDEIIQTQMHAFLEWQFETYLANFRQLRDQVEKHGKTALARGRGIPLMPPGNVPEFAKILGAMSCGAGLDASGEDFSRSAASAMALKAFNPMWELNCPLAWGRDCAVYSERTSAVPPGVTETSRRHAVAAAWRSVIDNDGRCSAVFSRGFDAGAGSVPELDGNDMQQLWYASQRIVRIRPDGPIGMGLCLGAGALTDGGSFVFSGGGSGGNGLADRLLGRSFGIVLEMHRRRVGVSFAANASALMNSAPSLREPLLVPLAETFSADERAFVANWAKTRGKIVFVTDGKAIAPEFAELFGEAVPQDGNDAVSLSKYGVMIDRELEKITQDDYDLAARLVRENFKLGTEFPEGVAGYAFTSNRRRFIAVEDIREEAREVTVKVRAGTGKTASAMEFDEHRSLAAERDGDFWSVTLPLKKADGNLIMIEEK